MRYLHYLLYILVGILFSCTSPESTNNSKELDFIYGWNILSDKQEKALNTIQRAKDYKVNHLQLSHHIVHDLREVKEEEKQILANELIDAAHQEGIPEVVLWDHALYGLNYYPDSLRKAPGNKIDLDKPSFWSWFKQDYRNMLDLVPNMDGIVLTFIETGARIEEQYSQNMPTAGEKLAALVDAVADVIVEERKLKLYIRTFIYNKTELASMLDCINRIDNPDLVVMVKETPHDFFITHPPTSWIPKIKYPVIVEFDATHEFNGQGIVASIFPETHLKRWQLYQSFDNVKGFSIRTDRYGNTSILGRPSEVNLYAIHRGAHHLELSADQITKDFISEKYGEEALPILKAVYKAAPEIILSSFYSLGLNTANHSKLDFDYRSIYTRHVSGRWKDNKNIYIEHDVNQQFHYWKDVVNHLAPPKHKKPEGNNLLELPEVFDSAWIDQEERMNAQFLNYVVKEKDWSVNKAEWAIGEVKKLNALIPDSSKYQILYQTFYCTLLAVKIRRAVAKAYYANRVTDPNENTERIKQEGLQEIQEVSKAIEAFEGDIPSGQYNWRQDAERARAYAQEIEHMD